MKIKLSDDEYDILRKSLILNRGDFMKAVVEYILKINEESINWNLQEILINNENKTLEIKEKQ